VAVLNIELLPLDWEEMLPLARKYNRNAYEAAFLTLGLGWRSAGHRR
jgi:hypothetical protein